MAVLRVAGAILTMTVYLPAYAAGAAWEALRQGWRAGRADVRSLTE